MFADFSSAFLFEVPEQACSNTTAKITIANCFILLLLNDFFYFINLGFYFIRNFKTSVRGLSKRMKCQALYHQPGSST